MNSRFESSIGHFSQLFPDIYHQDIWILVLNFEPLVAQLNFQTRVTVGLQKGQKGRVLMGWGREDWKKWILRILEQRP